MKLLKWSTKALFSLCVLSVPLFVNAAAPQWENWISTQVQHHPEIIAANNRLAAVQSIADAQEQVLYNPEFVSEVERVDGVKNYRIGIDQTIDWWDKKEARIEQSRFIRQAAELNYQNLVMKRVADAMKALVEWESAKKIAEMARKQKLQLDTLLSLVEKRRAAGDMGSIDAELTFLSLSQRLSVVAEAEAGLKKIESTVKELLPDWSPVQGGIPAAFWIDYQPQEGDKWIESHPAVASSKAEWKVLEQQAEVTQRDVKADPTFGIKAGRDDNANAVGLSFSIPLNVRNNYDAETSAARQEALEAEALFYAQYRRQKFTQQAARCSMERI